MRGYNLKWIKHDTDANQDAKLQNVMLDYGLEGYGLYWYCIELIAGKVDKENITFELEHDARIIARNTGSTTQKVEEMMKYFVKTELFENISGVITCMKLAKRLDKSMTSNPEMRDLIASMRRHDGVMTESAKPMQDKIRLDESRIDNKDTMSCKPDVVVIINHLNSVVGTKYKTSTKSHIQNISARLEDGHSVEDLKAVIDSKFKDWGHDPKMAQYLRPSTLFQASKFQGYLTASKTIGTGQHRDINQIGTDFSQPAGFKKMIFSESGEHLGYEQ